MNTYRYAIKELVRHRTRTAVNILGYAIAVAFMVTVISMTQSYSLAAVDVLKSTGTHFMAFIPQSQPRCEGQFESGPVAEGVYTSILDISALTMIKDLPGVKDAAPYLLFKMYHDRHEAFLTIGGIDPTSLATMTTVCAATNVLKGRYLTTTDRNAVVLEESYAYAANLDVNSTLNAFGREFDIVGIVNCGIKPAKADMYAPIAVVREIAQQYYTCVTGDINMNIVLVEVADARMQEDVFQAVQNCLGGAIISSYNCYVPARDVIDIVERTSWATAIFAAIFVTLLSSKSQLASMVERTRDIGILKSLGWLNSSIIQQIVIESIIQALIGGIIGCIIAIFAVPVVRWGNLTSGGNMITGLSFSAIAAGMALALIGGVIAGILPAWRASKLQPAEALRRV